MAPPAPLKVLISGAGIAGPTTAYWLSLIDSDITIIEKAPNLRATGQQIDLRGQAIVLMKLMKLTSAINAIRCPEQGMRIIDALGQSHAYIPANTTGKGAQSGTSEYELMRGDLVRVLYHATQTLPNVRYLFDCSISSFTQDDSSVSNGKVHVTFSNGLKDSYDVVIGADGVGSPVRTLMLPPSSLTSSPNPKFDLGVHLSFFTVPPSKYDSPDWTICQTPGRKVIMTRKDSPDNLRVYLGSRGNECCQKLDAARTLAEQKAAIVDIFKDVQGAQMDRFLSALQESELADDLYSAHMTQVKLPAGAWARGRVVLVGDAAYCPTPFGQGSGCTTAFLGAYVVAGEIVKRWRESSVKKQFDLEEAGRAYERIMRPFVEEKQSSAPRILPIYFPETAWGVWLVQRVMGVLAMLGVFRLIEWLTPEESQKLEYEDYFGLTNGGEILE